MDNVLESFKNTLRYDSYTHDNYLWHLVPLDRTMYAEANEYINMITRSIIAFNPTIIHPELHARILLESIMIYTVETDMCMAGVDAFLESIEIVYGYSSKALKEISPFIMSSNFSVLPEVIRGLVPEGWLFMRWINQHSTLIILTEVIYDESLG